MSVMVTSTSVMVKPTKAESQNTEKKAKAEKKTK